VASIKEVTAHAGVPVATVSRVLNESPRVKRGVLRVRGLHNRFPGVMVKMAGKTNVAQFASGSQ
jgi:hypothetical protein